MQLALSCLSLWYVLDSLSVEKKMTLWSIEKNIFSKIFCVDKLTSLRQLFSGEAVAALTRILEK